MEHTCTEKGSNLLLFESAKIAATLGALRRGGFAGAGSPSKRTVRLGLSGADESKRENEGINAEQTDCTSEQGLSARAVPLPVRSRLGTSDMLHRITFAPLAFLQNGKACLSC